MIEINSTKIPKEILLDKIQKIIDTQKAKPPRKERDLNSYVQTVSPSIKSHTSKNYVYLKKISQMLHKIGLSKLVPYGKKIVNKLNLNTSAVYIVEDFSKFHDEEFIKNVFLGVLKREVDQPSLEYYLNILRLGKRTKTEILTAVRFSKEGRQKNVKILGIKKRFIVSVIYKIPIIGYLSKTFVTLLTLPKIIEKLNKCEALHDMHQKNIQDSLTSGDKI